MNSLSHRTYLSAMLVILLLAAAMRFYALTADAPLYLTRSQELSTDGPNTVGFARDWVLFGVRPLPYLQPGLTLVAYSVFSLLGVGYWQANFIAVSSSLLAIVLTAGFARQQWGRRAALVSALVMAFNFPYLIYSRTPMVYVPLTCGLALALYCWGRGLRRPWWFFGSGLVALFSVIYIKIAGITFLGAAIVGLLILGWRRWRQQQPAAWSPLILFLAGSALMAGIAWIHLFTLTSVDTLLPYDVSTRTFNPAHGVEENVRFAMVSVFQFGIYSGFFIWIFLLFIVGYIFLFYRGVQLLGEDRPTLAMSEIIVWLYLAFTVLMLLASNTLPFRFMISLIPPLSLIAAMALETWLRLDNIVLPARLKRRQILFIFLTLTYFLYQCLAAGLKTVNALRLATSLVDYQVIIDLPILFVLLITSLLLVMVGILVFVWWTGTRPPIKLNLPSLQTRNLIAWLVVAGILWGDLYQYGNWTNHLQYSIVEASRSLPQELGEDVILGGSYAYVLTLENKLPAVQFYTYNINEPPGILDPKFTHIAVDADSFLKDGPFNEEGMFKVFPDAMKQAKLLKTYTLRGYFINLYEIKQ